MTERLGRAKVSSLTCNCPACPRSLKATCKRFWSQHSPVTKKFSQPGRQLSKEPQRFSQQEVACERHNKTLRSEVDDEKSASTRNSATKNLKLRARVSFSCHICLFSLHTFRYQCRLLIQGSSKYFCRKLRGGGLSFRNYGVKSSICKSFPLVFKPIQVNSRILDSLCRVFSESFQW